jgi:oligopeptide/dipeptide ABC transporter ATP-binding protein
MIPDLLSIHNLRTCFYTDLGLLRAVDGISFSMGYGETIGIVGESGCGKSVTARSIMRLIPHPPGKIESGEIYFEGKNLLDLSQAEMRKIRGNKISMIFQDPMTSLNPVFKIGKQIAEAIKLHQGVSLKEALEKSIEMLQIVGIPSPAKRVFDYPHQLSGGMRQRVMIAMALSCRPKLMIADEPTTALDVTIQAQILNLMQKLKEETGASIILITHNLGIVAEMAQKVIVMYAGRIFEYASTKDLFRKHYHPYTENLLKAIPKYDSSGEAKKLHVIPGIVPSLLNLPQGCKLSNRCDRSFPLCFEEEPGLFEVEPGHIARCWLYSEKSPSQSKVRTQELVIGKSRG